MGILAATQNTNGQGRNWPLEAIVGFKVLVPG